jgi:hypothetical protein
MGRLWYAIWRRVDLLVRSRPWLSVIYTGVGMLLEGRLVNWANQRIDEYIASPTLWRILLTGGHFLIDLLIVMLPAAVFVFILAWLDVRKDQRVAAAAGMTPEEFYAEAPIHNLAEAKAEILKWKERARKAEYELFQLRSRRQP